MVHIKVSTFSLFCLTWISTPMFSAPAGRFSVACAPDSVIVAPGSQVRIRVWPASDAKPFKVTWQKHEEHLPNGSGAITWIVGSEEDMQEVHLTLVDAKGFIGNCKVRVLVRIPGPDRGETGRAYLLKATPEETGYGWYSYLLFGAVPPANDRTRYLSAVQAFLDLAPPMNELRAYTKDENKNRLNIAYLPILSGPASISKDRMAEWILNNYDYARARAYLDALPGARRTGMWVVSTPAALYNVTSLRHPYLPQNLTYVQDTLVRTWIENCFKLAWQERWDTEGGDNFALKLRTMLANVAADLPSVRTEITSWIESLVSKTAVT